MKFAGNLALVLLGMLLGMAVLVFGWSELKLRQVIRVAHSPVAVPQSVDAIERGRRLAITGRCTSCHGEDLAGAHVLDRWPIARIEGPNLTAGEGGIGAEYGRADWDRAIRHGIGRDGRALRLMPSQDYYHMSDRDLGALVAYLTNVPPVDRVRSRGMVGPVGRLLYLAGQFPLLSAETMDHEEPRRHAPSPGPNSAYGEYLAHGCRSCHGADLSGGWIPDAPPAWRPASNLTPNEASGLGEWSESDFVRAMREGIRPDSTRIHPSMPWESYAAFTNQELRALWRYLSTLPVRPFGGEPAAPPVVEGTPDPEARSASMGGVRSLGDAD